MDKDEGMMACRIMQKQIRHQDPWAFARWGAKNFVCDAEKPELRFAVRGKGIRNVSIRLDEGQDLYDIEFGRIKHGRGLNPDEYVKLRKAKGMYNDDLVRVIDGWIDEV